MARARPPVARPGPLPAATMSTAQTTDGFLDLVEQSGLLPPDRVAGYRDAEPPGDPARPPAPRLAGQMVRDRLLTTYQAQQLLRGRSRGFFLTDKYKVLEPIGTGGMGKVFLCEHLILHRLVAVKVLAGPTNSKPSTGAVERFYREARAVAALDHRNIVRVFDMDMAGASPIMVMEYVDGADLHRLVQAGGPLGVDRAADCGRQAADGLQHAHESGLVHRDIKPGNILIDRTGTVKLLDLGLARFMVDVQKNQSVTERFDGAVILGTADFISPEQTLDSSRVDIRSDIYSLGGTLYFALTGKMPFEDGSLPQKLLWHQTRVPPSVRDTWPDIPEGLAAAVAKMLAKEPADRYQTPAEVSAALAPWASPPPGPPPSQHMPKLNPGMYLLGLSPMPPPASARTRVQAAAATAAGGPPSTPGVSGRGTDRMRPPAKPAAPAKPAFEVVEDEPPPAPSPGRRPSSPGRRPSLARWRPVWLLLVAVGAALVVGAAAGYYALRPPRDDGGGGAVAAPSRPDVVTGVVPVRGTVRAAGSTFVAPLMSHWTGIYRGKTGVDVGYGGGGSGRGVGAVLAGEVDFGCTDAPLTDAELATAKEAGREVVHVPLVLGAVVATYNLPGVKSPVRFTGPVLADIYLGEITHWDHPALAANNPGLALPHTPIAVVHRGADRSGTSFIWTDYLSKVSPKWRDGPGKGTAVAWPVGVAGKGSDGVAETVGRSPGAIGYVELTFAVAHNLPTGVVKNAAGEFVAPTLAGVTAAAEAAHPTFPADMRFTFTDPPGAGVYPIGGATWAVLVVTGGKASPNAVKFLEWATHDGQGMIAPLQYAPLPAALRTNLDATFYRLTPRN